MRLRMACLLAFLTLSVGALATWQLILGQEPSPVNRPAAPPPAAADNLKPARDLSRLSPLGQQMLHSAQRGGDWLFRANRPDGHFDYGFLPALAQRMDGDHYLRQVGAAFALAREARFTGDPRHAAIARQAVLALLLETVTDDRKQLRHTGLPSMAVNRLAAAGLLVLAINELPEPATELLDQSEQLCNYIHTQQLADGSLCCTDDPSNPQSAEPETINSAPGEALYALILSQHQRPAPWKTDLVRKALPFYRSWWQKNKSMAFVPWQSAAFAEAYLLTGEAPFAAFVNEMNDWLCARQYVQLDPRQPLWFGGFQTSAESHDEPQVESAAYAESLVEGCRVARKSGDLARHQRYREALERCLQFVSTLQYTDANTQHFVGWYRPRLVGGFHAAPRDGNLRIDYAQHAVSALVQYLAYVAD